MYKYYTYVYIYTHICYVYVQDVNTLKDDVKSLTQLVIVVQDIADDEADYTILNYYKEIIYSTNRSIVALNNLVSSIFIK